MKDKTHEELRGGMLCIIAFTIGCVLAFSGCSATTEIRASVFDRDVGTGAGIYLQGERNVGEH